MNASKCLNLNRFVSALEHLCTLSEDPHADPQQILAEASSLCTSIAASALLSVPADPSCEWEGYLNDDILTIYSATNQLLFTLMFNTMNSATITGSAPVIWKINVSEKGTYVSAVGSDGTIYQDVLIDKTGAVSDPRDVEKSLAELKQELDRIADTPDDALPDYTPDSFIKDIELSEILDIDELPDIDSESLNTPVSNSSSASKANLIESNNGTSLDNAFREGFGDALGSALKGAAAVGSAAVFGMASRAVDRAVNKVFSASESALKTAKPEPKPAESELRHPEAARLEIKAQKHPASLSGAENTGQSIDLPELLLEGESGQQRFCSFPCKIGRSKEADFKLDSNLVSRNHACFSLVNGLIEVEDLGSSNGTFVNETKISAPVVLKKGMKLRFANLTFEVLACPEPKSELVDSNSMKTLAFNMTEKLAQAEKKFVSAQTSSSATPTPAEKSISSQSNRLPPNLSPKVPSLKPNVPLPKKPVLSAPKISPTNSPSKSAVTKPESKPSSLLKPVLSKPVPPDLKVPPHLNSQAGTSTTSKEAKLRCKKCQTKLPSNAKFCTECGAPIVPEKIRCACGTFCDSGAKFCSNCGKPLGIDHGSDSKSRSLTHSQSVHQKQPPPPPGIAPVQSTSTQPPPPPPPSTPSRGTISASKRLSHAEKERRRKEREALEDNAFIKRVASDQVFAKNSLPSVRWVSFLFFIVMFLDHVRIVIIKGEGVIENMLFLIGLGSGCVTVFFAFIAGASPGICRFFTMISALVYLGSQIMRDHTLISVISKNPAIIEKNKELILPLLALLFAVWLVKRAARQS